MSKVEEDKGCPTCPKPNPNPAFTCEESKFTPAICSEEPTGVLFLGRQTQNPDELLRAMMEAELDEVVNFGVIDLMDDACAEISQKYNIDLDSTQLVVFKKCEKMGAISLEDADPKVQVDTLLTALGLKKSSKEPTDGRTPDNAVAVPEGTP